MLGKPPAIRIQLVHLIRHEFLSGPTLEMDFVDVRKVPEFIEDNTNSTEEPAWKHRTYKLYIQKFTYPWPSNHKL